MITFLRIASWALRIALNLSSFIYTTLRPQCVLKEARLQILRGYLARLHAYEALAIIFEEFRKILRPRNSRRAVAALPRHGPLNRRLKPFEFGRYNNEKKSPIFYTALLRLVGQMLLLKNARN